jgi:dTDP-4-dehydrorhamnose reductase
MSEKRVLITGSSGQLGRALQALDRPDWIVQPTTSGELDIRDWRTVRDRFAALSPHLVIHAAAATNVDQCERQPEMAYETNALGTRHVAQASALAGAALVYISTNYVFEGQKSGPYHEFDQPNPISVYGASKLAGEKEALNATSRCHVVRTASVYSEHGHNFVRTMRGLMDRLDRVTVVNDQYSNPTYAADLALAVAEIADRAPFGVYHATNEGTASWHEWAVEIADRIGATTKIAPIPASEFQRDAEPPANGALVSLSLSGLGITLPAWRDGLKRCLERWPE